MGGGWGACVAPGLLQGTPLTGSAVLLLRSLACVQHLGKWGYLSLGLIAAPPCVLLPMVLQPAAEREKPWAQRYWVKVSRGGGL